MRVGILFGLALVLVCASANAASIAILPNASWTERAAAGDLQRVIYAATGKLLPIGPFRSGDREVIAIGFSPFGESIADRSHSKMQSSFVPLAANSAALRSSREHATIPKAIGDEGFILKTVRRGGKTVLVAAGSNAVSTSYAVYTLAEKYGAGFYLGGDALPTKRIRFEIPMLDIVSEPCFKVRGVLPWYNFFDSPTAWNIEDYRSFIDQLAKSKNNFLGFHSYDHEPFCAYRDANGKVVAGAPLVSTGQSTWGTAPMSTSLFAPSARGCFENQYFGADCSMGYKSPEEGVASAKKLLSQALWYAKARGVKTCVGFEVTGDPTAPGELDRLEARLKNLLQSYPMLDYVWIWEPEAMGLNGIDPRGAWTDLGAYYRRWDSTFSYIEDPKRRSEAVRVGIYALAAHRIIEREAPGVKMILSGWGGDNHLRFTDFYPGYDKILPKDIIFSALDNIIVSDTVSTAYGKLSRDREFWPIPWFEYDGDQWCPQPNTARFTNAARDALKKHASGLLAIHWRTRDVEESHAYISQFAWNPKLSYEGFYKDYAGKAYGDEKAAGLLMELQGLGYRWIGGSGQTECGGFAWNAAPEGGVERMNGAFDRHRGLPASERLDDLKDIRAWLESYDLAARVLRSDGRLCATMNSIGADNRQATDDEKAVIENDLADARTDLSNAIEAASRRVANRGELGILATINTKAWSSLLSIEKQAGEIAGVHINTAAEPGSEGFEVKSILRTDTTFAGEPMRISAIALGASPRAKADVVYRQVGSKAYSSAPLKFESAGRLDGAIPAPKDGLVEYYLRVVDGGKKALWPKGGPAAPALVSVVPAPRNAAVSKSGGRSAMASKMAAAKCVQGPLLVTVSWPEFASVRAFKVMRSDGTGWHAVATARDNWFEDRNVEVGGKYGYRVVDADTGLLLAEGDSGQIRVPPVPAAPTVKVEPGPGRVRLSWAPNDMMCSAYQVLCAEMPDGPFEAVRDVRPQYDNSRGARVCDCPLEPGEIRYYAVRGVSLGGKTGPTSEPVAATALEVDRAPVLRLDFDGKDARNRAVEQGISCLRTGPQAFAQLPHQDKFNPEGDLTLEFMIKLRTPGVMPIFLCHGMWNQDGLFVQYYGGRIRFYLAGVGTLDAGHLDVGKWTSVVATYNGAEMVLYVNGREAGRQPGAGVVTPTRRPFYVCRYDFESSEFVVDGWIGGVRMYRYAVSPDEAKACYEEMVGETSVSGS